MTSANSIWVFIEQTEGQVSELDRIVSIFAVDNPVLPAPKAVPKSQPAARFAAHPESGIKALQARVTTSAKIYLNRENSAGM